MRITWLSILVGMAVALPAQQPKSQTQSKPGTAVTGVFLGRSGKPMAGARLILGEALEFPSKIRLLPNVPTVTTDKEGKFAIRGFTPGRWTIIYQPAGVDVAVPNEIDIIALEAVDKSILPLLVRVELGTDKAYEPRPWGRQFTLLKGHTLYSMGAQMKIWNATARRGQQGPYLELRRGHLWTQEFEDKGQVRFDAWSF